MQRWQFPIHNGTLETFILSKNVILGLNVDSEMGTLVENNNWKKLIFKIKNIDISNSYLIRQGYRCELGIVIFTIYMEGYALTILRNMLFLFKILD